MEFSQFIMQNFFRERNQLSMKQFLNILKLLKIIHFVEFLFL
jgi:hypothetical protein